MPSTTPIMAEEPVASPSQAVREVGTVGDRHDYKDKDRCNEENGEEIAVLSET